MPRPSLEPGTHGLIRFREITHDGKVKGHIAYAQYRDHTGRKRQVEARDKSKSGADRKLRARLTEWVGAHDAEITPRSTVGTLAGRWWHEIETSPLAAGTKQRYKELTRESTHKAPQGVIRAGLGHLNIQMVTVGTLERFLKVTTENHGPGTARLARTVLVGMFDMAARHDAIPRNFVKDTKPITSTVPEVRALTSVELRTLRKALENNAGAHTKDVIDLFDLLAGTGMRIGEALALRWQDTNLHQAIPTVSVTGTIVSVPGQGTIRQEHPKTDSSIRTMPIPPGIVAMLNRRRFDLIEANKWDVVFPSATNTLRDPSNMRKQWRPLMESANFAWVTPKVLRKTVATLLARELSDEAAQAQLGHSSVAMTKGRYIQRSAMVPDYSKVFESFGY